MISMTEDEILDKIKEGDKNLYSYFYNKYFRKIYNLAYRCTRNPEDATDITQESFIKAYNSLNSFRRESKFYTWIYKIALNVINHYFLQRKKLNAIPWERIDLVPNSEDSEENNSDDSYFQANLNKDTINYEDYEEISALLKTTSIEIKFAFELREVMGCSYEEIAKIMNCPLGTVRSRLYRAREYINKNIDKTKEYYDA